MIVSDKFIISLNNYPMQDVKPFSSSSLGQYGAVKDFKWLNHASSAYIVLSTSGLLCQGGLGEGLKDVMENVDAGLCLLSLLIPLHLNLGYIPPISAMCSTGISTYTILLPPISHHHTVKALIEECYMDKRQYIGLLNLLIQLSQCMILHCF